MLSGALWTLHQKRTIRKSCRWLPLSIKKRRKYYKPLNKTHSIFLELGYLLSSSRTGPIFRGFPRLLQRTLLHCSSLWPPSVQICQLQIKAVVMPPSSGGANIHDQSKSYWDYELYEMFTSNFCSYFLQPGLALIRITYPSSQNEIIEKLIVFQVVKKFQTFYGTLEYITVLTAAHWKQVKRRILSSEMRPHAAW
jgi:hypothetical protein